MTSHVVLHLNSGQTVRLPLRPRGRGVEKPPIGPEELHAWLEKRPEVLMFTQGAIAFAHVEDTESGDQP